MVKTVLATDMTHHFEHVNAFKVRFCKAAVLVRTAVRRSTHPPTQTASVLFSTAKARRSLGLAKGHSL
jgi:hypothetical protein